MVIHSWLVCVTVYFNLLAAGAEWVTHTEETERKTKGQQKQAQLLDTEGQSE